MKEKYQLEILTPVHIGSGETLNFMAGCYANRRWYHIDLDKVLAHPSVDLNALTAEMSRRDFRWQRYLQQHNMEPAEFAAYGLTCQQSPEEVEIREAIKTVDNRPYIPGSTIKGALRTVLLWDIINNEDEDHYTKSLVHLKSLKPQPARQIESLAFGKNPNHDLLRALQVSDTALLESDALEMGVAWTVTLDQNDQLVPKIEGSREYKNFVQQIRAGECLTFTLKIDEWLFGEQANNRLHFGDSQIDAIQNIADVCNWVNDDLIKREKKFFDAYNRPEIANFYDKLGRCNQTLPERAFILQIGWGTGYNAKTVTSLFLSDEELDQELDEDTFMDSESLMELRKRFQLGRSRNRHGPPYDKREFPKTRRVLYQGQNPITPLGWVKISPTQD